jgi:hypothetical protein
MSPADIEEEMHVPFNVDVIIVDGNVGGEVSMAVAVGTGVSISVGAVVSISMGAGVKTTSMGAAINFWVGACVTTVETTGAGVTTATGSKSPISIAYKIIICDHNNGNS